MSAHDLSGLQLTRASRACMIVRMATLKKGEKPARRYVVALGDKPIAHTESPTRIRAILAQFDWTPAHGEAAAEAHLAAFRRQRVLRVVQFTRPQVNA